jgi:hypothetical protein
MVSRDSPSEIKRRIYHFAGFVKGLEVWVFYEVPCRRFAHPESLAMQYKAMRDRVDRAGTGEVGRDKVISCGIRPDWCGIGRANRRHEGRNPFQNRQAFLTKSPWRARPYDPIHPIEALWPVETHASDSLTPRYFPYLEWVNPRMVNIGDLSYNDKAGAGRG